MQFIRKSSSSSKMLWSGEHPLNMQEAKKSDLIMCWKMKTSSVYSKNNYFARQLWIMYQIMAIISLSTIVLFSLPIDDHSAICDESSFKGMVTT
ncbi:cytoplasmic protein [Cryptococcus neoformans C23]|nr:cytoplasmic protein [Cryptococcus neoformans var. grubii C23]